MSTYEQQLSATGRSVDKAAASVQALGDSVADFRRKHMPAQDFSKVEERVAKLSPCCGGKVDTSERTQICPKCRMVL